MKKSNIVLSLLIISSISMTSCSLSKTDAITVEIPKGDTSLSTSTSSTDENYNAPVGKIIKFDGDLVHILFGDVVDTYKIDQNTSKKFYIGESVKLIENGDIFTLESFLDSDFSVEHTNMGRIIESLTGIVNKDTDGKTISITNSEGNFEYEYSGDITFKTGDNISINYVKFDPSSDQIQIIDIYNNDSVVKLFVDSINRDESGYLTIGAKDNSSSENIDFIVTISESTLLNFNHSTLKKGDLIVVYADSILESYPAQMTAKKVVLESNI